jgi:hypothetical protein
VEGTAQVLGFLENIPKRNAPSNEGQGIPIILWIHLYDAKYPSKEYLK